MTSRESRSNVASSCVRLAVSAASSASPAPRQRDQRLDVLRGYRRHAERGGELQRRSARKEEEPPQRLIGSDGADLRRGEVLLRPAHLEDGEVDVHVPRRAQAGARLDRRPHPLHQLEPLLGVADVFPREQRAHVRRPHPGTGLGESHPLAGPGGFHRLLHLLEALATLPPDLELLLDPDDHLSAGRGGDRVAVVGPVPGVDAHDRIGGEEDAGTHRLGLHRASLETGALDRRTHLRRPGERIVEGERQRLGNGGGGAQRDDQARDMAQELRTGTRTGHPHGVRPTARHPSGPTGPRAYAGPSARDRIQPRPTADWA
jgi:hypothetical protein